MSRDSDLTLYVNLLTLLNSTHITLNHEYIQTDGRITRSDLYTSVCIYTGYIRVYIQAIYGYIRL